MVESESESEADARKSEADATLGPNLPDRPLNVKLRKRAAAKVVEDEDSDKFE